MIGFKAGGALKQLTFSDMPLGFELERKAPVKIKKVMEGSHADILGARVGWVLETIGLESVRGQHYSKVSSKLRDAAQALVKAKAEMAQMAGLAEKEEMAEKTKNVEEPVACSSASSKSQADVPIEAQRSPRVASPSTRIIQSLRNSVANSRFTQAD